VTPPPRGRGAGTWRPAAPPCRPRSTRPGGDGFDRARSVGLGCTCKGAAGVQLTGVQGFAVAAASIPAPRFPSPAPPRPLLSKRYRTPPSPLPNPSTPPKPSSPPGTPPSAQSSRRCWRRCRTRSPPWRHPRAVPRWGSQTRGRRCCSCWVSGVGFGWCGG